MKFGSCTGQSPIFSCCEHSLVAYFSTAYIIPMRLSINPQNRNSNLLRGKMRFGDCDSFNVHKPGMISTSQTDLPWGHRAESCFNYPGFLLSHCQCEEPGATLLCNAESPCRGGDDNSDNGSACSTDPPWVPSEIWEAESIPLSPWFSLFLPLFALCCSFLFPCQTVLMERTEYVTMEWELNRLSPSLPCGTGSIHLELSLHEGAKIIPTLYDFHMFWTCFRVAVSIQIFHLWIQNWKGDFCGNLFPLIIQ